MVASKSNSKFWTHIAYQNLLNIGLGSDLLPDSTKPLPEPILTYHE